MLFRLATIVVAIIVLALPATAHAHGGGLDGLGCHHNRKAGGYHCHRGSMAGQAFVSKQEALESLEEGQSQPPEPSPESNTVSGKPRIVDGDTIWIGGTKIRLHGIDAPESKQMCHDKGGKEWRCGDDATFALARLIETHWVTCKGDERDKYGRLIAVCFAGPYDLNAKMVRNGWALAYRKYSNDYVDEEALAKVAGIGMWRGKFMPPWEWRKR